MEQLNTELKDTLDRFKKNKNKDIQNKFIFSINILNLGILLLEKMIEPKNKDKTSVNSVLKFRSIMQDRLESFNEFKKENKPLISKHLLLQFDIIRDFFIKEMNEESLLKMKKYKENEELYFKYLKTLYKKKKNRRKSCTF